MNFSKFLKDLLLPLLLMFFILGDGVSVSYAMQEEHEEVPVVLVHQYINYGEGRFGEPVEEVLLEGDEAFIEIQVLLAFNKNLNEDLIITRVSPIFKNNAKTEYSFVDLKENGLIEGFRQLNTEVKQTEEGNFYNDFEEVYIRPVGSYGEYELVKKAEQKYLPFPPILIIILTFIIVNIIIGVCRIYKVF